ncbi:membrane protein insertase YidC [Trueperella pecoris]|uniref:Membrane protein insertase YidC n=1 Tax=Trueperella pecoris TaxID=2733571 RepID=A0A7M1QV14_9ACTO|nr:membrane protein insertase YidC [Trueperella pecoris]QOQ39710.1 membrane protein insertase YidC [Trueperella pecoris]QOR45663.1 membrane protein insertase YidC [Trueperella pecoris]QTG75504.1 membrane protein insertase YidC [Trueperella pecoris]
MDTFLYPLMWIISYIMYGVHSSLTALGMSDGSGPAWVLSIVGLTVIVRILIIPLFNKQTRASRASQELAPEIRKIQKKYQGRKDQVSQQRQQEEMMALYRDHGTSPFAACMPALIQMPIFFALFRLLYAVLPISQGNYQRTSLGPIDQQVAQDIAHSTLFGAPLTSSISTASQFSLPTNVIVVAIVLIALMMATLFFSQKQIMTKNLPEESMDPDNPAYKMQKYMLYGMPLIYLFSGGVFQIGVLVYWLTGNFWNIGQQTWLITTNPAPGSAAYKARQKKLREKRIAKGLPPEEENDAVGTGGQRVQPLGKKRSKKAREGNAFEMDPTPSTKEPQEVRGLDGLTDAERAKKRYERRMAERQRSNAKKQQKEKKRQQNQRKRNF